MTSVLLPRRALFAGLLLVFTSSVAQATPQAYAVDVDHLGAMVLFGEDGPDAVHRFVDGLIRRQVFPDAKLALRAWGKTLSLKATDAPTLASLRHEDAPLIGVQLGELEDLVGDTETKRNRAPYLRALERAGARALFLPPAASQRQIGATLRELDHLILAGGDDIHPSLYGQPVTYARGLNLKRDRYEQRLVQRALRLGLGVEGIRRGCQMMNVAAGGTLTQDLVLDGVTRTPHRTADGHPLGHVVLIEKDSETAKTVGARVRRVVSWHHQALDEVAPGFRIVGRAPDGVPEIMEGRGGKARCYQFHPERSGRATFSKALFKDMVSRAKAYAKTR